ncbi:MFS transporter [Clostridium sp. Marseille-Q2269]|uniref:MFS transporter n=1 Tax=Clostridium sp. Marseille-Q2269 TaxID=2942205 RepID=UPI0033656791
MKNKNFIIIVIGQIISLFGNAIQRFSMSLYLLELTGSTAAFANILAISTIPYIVFAPIAGRLSDKVNRKKIMVYLDFFCSVLIGVYAFILFKGRDTESIAAVVMFILSICSTLYGPAVVSLIPQIVDKDKLTSANGIINQVSSAVNFTAPILSIVAPYFINILLELPSEIYGIVEGICVLGMVLGSLWISLKPNMFSMKKVHYTYFPMIAGVMLMSILGFIKLNNYTLAWLFGIGGMAIMLSLSLSNVLTLTFIQKEVPGHMLGSVSAFSTAEQL